jgi:hypothetical protein
MMSRAAALVPDVSVPLPESFRSELRDRLTSGIAPVVERLPEGQQIVVTLPLLRRARTDPEGAAMDEPFSWKPALVRRSLGLAVVDACVSGRFASPAEAVGPVVEAAVAEWERTGWRTFHWEPWFAGLPQGARAVVLAEALSWATVLLSSLDRRLLGTSPQIGGGDDQWVCPAPRTVRLKSRSDLRVGGGGDAHALLSVASGCPGPEWDVELGYLALVAALRSPSRPVATRVTGLWPDAGASRTTEIDAPALAAAADLVVATVASVVAGRLTLGQNRH